MKTGQKWSLPVAGVFFALQVWAGGSLGLFAGDQPGGRRPYHGAHALADVQAAIVRTLLDPGSYRQQSADTLLLHKPSRRYRVHITYLAREAPGMLLSRTTVAEVDSSHLVHILE